MYRNILKYITKCLIKNLNKVNCKKILIKNLHIFLKSYINLQNFWNLSKTKASLKQNVFRILKGKYLNGICHKWKITLKIK